MKNLFKSLFLTLAVAGGTLLTSCSKENNAGLKEPTNSDPKKKTYKLIVNPTNAAKINERNLIITAEPNSQVPVSVTFKGSRNMFRLYMTQNLIGGSEGAVPFKYTYDAAKLKADGSINLDASDKETFTYNLKFPAPKVKDQTVQYVLWATHARGDFRNFNKRNAVDSDKDGEGDAIGVITIKAGTVAPATTTTGSTGVKSFSAVLLAAPLADGTSKSFISLFNNKVYSIDQGEEYAALWDLGYYYGNTKKASLASTNNYPTDIVNVPAISKVAAADLNKLFIGKSNKTAADFDKIVKGTELDNIVKPTTQRVNGLTKDNVLEFVDAYGNKGLIKITEVKGTYKKGGYIKFDVKVQVKSVPIKG